MIAEISLLLLMLLCFFSEMYNEEPRFTRLVDRICKRIENKYHGTARKN